jgi:hypothetical protein
MSFLYDVSPIFSRAGCNQGTCHGNASGRGGFHLSLRGEDPAFDYRSLTREAGGRRVNRADPSRSLLLLKPTARLPHGGGLRFNLSSPEFRVLAAWVARGALYDSPGAPRLQRLTVTPAEKVLVEPARSQQLLVVAQFGDGSARDVTREAAYETSEPAAAVSRQGLVSGRPGSETAVLVRFVSQQAVARITFVPRRPGFVWKPVPANNRIDTLVNRKLRSVRMLPSGLCLDETFVRRAYLDALGILPTPEETRAFLAECRAERSSLGVWECGSVGGPGHTARERLIDRLLERPEFDDFWTLKWSDLLRVEERSLDATGVAAFQSWIRQSLAHRKPLDEFARELLTAEGSTYANPEANYYRRTRTPDELAEVTAQLFMGVRLRCARCHNHPFDRWTLNDYYTFAATFARVQHKFDDLTRRDKFDTHELNGEETIFIGDPAPVRNPRTGEVMTPRLPGGADRLPAPVGDARQALARWLTRPENSYFARSMANRIWFHLMGRGIVEPVDDFRASNPPANAALLDALAQDLVAAKFDLRALVRTIMRSRTYQLSASTNWTNRDDERYFSHTQLRRLPAETLMDAISQVTGVPDRFPGYPVGMRAVQLPPTRQPNPFLKLFGKPPRETACECERSGETTLNQSFALIAGAGIDAKLCDPGNRIGQLLAAGKRDDEILDEIYLAALCRYPRSGERRALLSHLRAKRDRRSGLEDVLWAVLNSKEFLLRP